MKSRKERLKKNKKPVEQICKNCLLFNIKNNTCSINIIHEGEYLELKTNPEDKCHWIESGLIDNVKQLRVWSDGKDGHIELS